MSELRTIAGEPGTEAAAIADIAEKAATPLMFGDHVFAFATPRHVVDFEQYDAQPRRKHGRVEVRTVAGLVEYSKRHVNDDQSTLWCDADLHRIEVVLNDHGKADGPQWGDHKVCLKLRPTPAWAAWTERNDKLTAQTSLAEFLEERVVDIAEPDGASILEATRTFHATTSARFKSAQSLHSGEQQLVYEEEIQAGVGGTREATVPREFTIVVAPFVGSEPVQVHGLFRFRVRDGVLALGYRLLNLEDVVDKAVRDVADVASTELGLPIIEGLQSR